MCNHVIPVTTNMTHMYMHVYILVYMKFRLGPGLLSYVSTCCSTDQKSTIVIVDCSYVTIILENTAEGGANISLNGLRAFRVLRALKSISVVPGNVGNTSALSLCCTWSTSWWSVHLHMSADHNKPVVVMVDYITWLHV